MIISNLEASRDYFKDDCYGGGKYCYYNYDDYNDKKVINGTEYLDQYIKQLCLIKNTSVDTWYATMMKYYQNELATLNSSLSDITKYISDPKIVSNVNDCFDNSFKGPDHYLADNTILKENSKQLNSNNVYWEPQLIVQRNPLNGNV